MKAARYSLAAIGFLILLGSQPSQAQIDIHGFFRSHSAIKTETPNEALLLRNRLRLNSEVWGENVYGYASLDFLNDAVVGQETRAELRELFLDIYGSWLDFRIGKQQVVWGKTDGYFINDIVNPLDLSLFLLQDFDDIRMGTTIFNAKFHHGNHSLEILVIPEFKPLQVNFSGNWAFARPDTMLIPPPVWSSTGLPIQAPMVYHDDVAPGISLKNNEYGLKFNTFFWGTDLSVMYLKIREDQPVYYTIPEFYTLYDARINLYPRHPWMTFYGLNFAKPAGLFVFRGEGGYYPERYYSTQDFTKINDGLIIGKPFVQAMIGVDYQLTGEIDISAQAIQERILDYEEGIITDEVNSIASLLLRGSFANETILPMWLTLYNISNESYLSRLAVDWKYSDSFTITIGTDILGGDKETIFGQFGKNDNVYLKLVYGF